MSVHHTDDCGSDRCYNFRRIQTNTIRFQVQAGNDVSICLSSDDQEQPEDMYEVFIGGWGGAESGIRRKNDEDICKVETPDIVSADEMRGFWIKISHGVIKVGRKGERQPFMSYTDPETPLHFTHYGFCTAYGSEGDWTFSDDKEDEDAYSSDSSGISSSDSEAEDLEALEEKPIQYKRPGRWVPAKGGYMPKNPVSGGEGADGPVYVGMAHHEGGNILGMVVPGEGCCYVPWGGESIAKDEYFVLASPSKVELTWVPNSDGNVPPGAFQGGFTEDGEPLFIGRINVDGVVSCGKIHPSHGVCYVPYSGAEHSHKHYEVLCVKSIPCRL